MHAKTKHVSTDINDSAPIDIAWQKRAPAYYPKVGNVPHTHSHPCVEYDTSYAASLRIKNRHSFRAEPRALTPKVGAITTPPFCPHCVSFPVHHFELLKHDIYHLGTRACSPDEQSVLAWHCRNTEGRCPLSGTAHSLPTTHNMSQYVTSLTEWRCPRSLAGTADLRLPPSRHRHSLPPPPKQHFRGQRGSQSLHPWWPEPASEG